MASPRALLTRVGKLERGRVSPILERIGGLEGWVALQSDVRGGIATGRYDPNDMPAILRCLRQWAAL